MTPRKESDILELARSVLEIEAAALADLPRRLDENFIRAVELLGRGEGRIVVTGIGKAGLIGRKISATLASTGSPSIWLHPAEALHGDLGIIGVGDTVMAVSNSGESAEIKALLPCLKDLNIPVVALTGRPDSSLGRAADVTLDASVSREACPDNLVPTASTTAALALGDAVAVCLKEMRGFKPDDFARLHPAGSLGRKLRCRVFDLMRTGQGNPVVGEDMPVQEVILAITRARAGAASVTGKDGKLAGIFTDGDLRRGLESDPEILSRPVAQVMTAEPITVAAECLAVEAMAEMRARKVDEIPVLDDEGRPVGMLDVQDLLSAGIV